MIHDVAIVGAGPAGLALAIESASRGLSTVVLEKGSLPCDKACGEGLMPSGVRRLEALGVRALLSPEDSSPFEGIRYIQEDGTTVQARLPDGGGLGVRRIALSSAMSARAQALGVDLRVRTPLRAHSRVARGFRLATDGETIEARLLVAADGLASPLRRAEGLAAPPRRPRRYGMRRHFRIEPWSDFVEVHFAGGVEAYVTPVGRQRVGIAFLWEQRAPREPLSFDSLLTKFPALEDKVRGAEADSPVMGAGPLEQRARRQTADQFVLLGDAAGYVDALTGEGLSLAFQCAAALGGTLPGALVSGGTRSALAPYQRAFGRAFRKYAWLAKGLLLLARHVAVRRRVIHWLSRHPAAFERIVGWAIA